MAGNCSQEATLTRGREARSNWMVIVVNDYDDDGKKLWPRGTLVMRIKDSGGIRALASTRDFLQQGLHFRPPIAL